MKIEDGFNTAPKAPAVARQSVVNTGLVVAAVSMAFLTGVIGYMLGMQSSSSRSLAGSQGIAPGGSSQQGGVPGGSGSTPPQTCTARLTVQYQPPNQTSQPTSNTPAQNQGANQTAPKTNPQPSANSTSNT